MTPKQVCKATLALFQTHEWGRGSLQNETTGCVCLVGGFSQVLFNDPTAIFDDENRAKRDKLDEVSRHFLAVNKLDGEDFWAAEMWNDEQQSVVPVLQALERAS